ncbi:MAG: AAA family ATPase [Rikenellaceae bacterium]
MANLIKQLNDYMMQNGLSQVIVSRSIGISDGALSAWRKGKYKGDNENIDNLIESYLTRSGDAQVEMQTKDDFDFVETSVYNDIYRGVRQTDLRGEIRVIVGVSGIGKTTALEHIKELNPSMILIKVYRGIRKNRFLQKLCKAAGVSDRGSFDDLFEELAERLDGTSRLIVIDEAEHLPIDAIDALRRLNDFTRCGLVLCGLPMLLSMLQHNQAQYGYIYNRMAVSVILKPLMDDDLKELVSTVLPSHANVLSWMDVCHGIGRDLRIILQESQRIAELNGITLDAKLIKTVKCSLGRIY